MKVIQLQTMWFVNFQFGPCSLVKSHVMSLLKIFFDVLYHTLNIRAHRLTTTSKSTCQILLFLVMMDILRDLTKTTGQVIDTSNTFQMKTID